MKREITKICTILLLTALSIPSFAGKVLAEIKYFYSDDGTLIGKAFNGKRVHFEYDLRGQLLAVKDSMGKDLERYTYDPAGNRLSKTINGLTTTYTYDKANQLVTSTVNGVTTHYKYDAAGRMIQAGDKSYIYNGQNKVAEVRQNGKTIAKFEYNIDGQIAKAIYGDKVEEFMWDGLALIWRSGVTYINEPAITGGNPVMAGDDVLFNDMLGNTLAVNGNSVEMTSFGETADKNAFFTGKPMIDELGYSFLFRDYNPNQGKWTTTDPFGYPDGWNNLAYVNNGVVSDIDLYGAWSLIRWLYTGDGNAPDAIYNVAIDKAGASYYDELQAAIAGMPVLGAALNYYGQTLSLVEWDAATSLTQSVMTDPLVKLFTDVFKTNLGKSIEVKKSPGTFAETSQLLTLDTGETFDLGSALILGRFYIKANASWTISHIENNKYRYNGTITYTINDRFDFDLKVRTLTFGLLELGKAFYVNVNWNDQLMGYFYE